MVGRSEKCARLGEVGSPVAAALLDLDTSLQDIVGAPQVSCAKEAGGDAAVVGDSSELTASPVLKRKWDRNRRRRVRRVISSTQSSSVSDSVGSGAGRQRGCAVSASSTPLSQPPDGGSQEMSPVSFTFDPSPLCVSARLQSPGGSPGGVGDVSLLLAGSARLATPPSGSGAASLSQMRRRALLERLSDTAGGSSPGNRLHQPEIPPSAVGPFHGLPSCVPALLKKQRGIDRLYAWQEECLALEAVRLRRNLVYSLPTSGGKTLVAELLIMKELVCRQRDCVFVLPYVAIVQEKVRSLAPFGIALGFIVAEYASSKGSFPPPKRRKRRTVYVCTIEKAAGLVASLLELGRADELGLAVVDEVHMLGDGSRGATLELLTLFLKHAAPNVQLVGMSATVGNMSDVCAFLEATSYSRPFRPVELREHVLLAGQLLEVTGTAADPPDQLLTPRRQVNFPQYTAAQKRADPDCLGGLVAEVIPANSCLVFCPTRKNCEAVAKLICQALSRELKEHLLDRKHALFRALLKESSGEVCPVLASTLPYGVAYHHSGLTTDERKLLEEAYLEGTLSCLCCTSTLAAGVNLPAKRVILRSPYTGSAFLTRSRYKQMAGRAGRAGIDDSGESILVVQTSDAKRVGALLTSPVEHCYSGLHDRDRHGLRRLVISAVALGLADSPQLLHQLASRSLLAVQGNTLQISLDVVLSEVVEELHKERLLRVCRTDAVGEAEGDDADAIVMSAADRLQSDVKLKVSRLGAAAVKGNVDLGVASRLYEDLRRAQPALAVINQLHLLYLVTPYDMMDDITPVASVYLDLFTSLDAEELAVAHLVGVSEHRLVKMMSGVAATGAVHRFYLTLMLHSVLGSGSLWRTADQFQVHRGLLQQLTAAAAGFAAGVLHFCRQLDELWPYAQLLEAFNRRLAVGYSQELLELLELPAVKQGRARALFAAGYSNLQTLANADPSELVAKLDHLPRRVARQIVDSAKMLVLERAEALQEEAEFMLDGLKTIEFHESPGLGELILTGINDEESARVKNTSQETT